MNTPAPATPYKNHRFQAEIISHGVWLYFRFCLSYRDVEGLLFARGIVATYEAIRKWCRKFGQLYANELRRRHPRPGDKWHLDEVSLSINSEHHYLWRAVDQDGHVLDILVQGRRDKQAAKREILRGVEHHQHRYLNNRAQNSHQPTRQREQRTQRFKSPGQAQRFLSAYGPIASHFRPRRHRLPAPQYRHKMRKKFPTWREITGAGKAA